MSDPPFTKYDGEKPKLSIVLSGFRALCGLAAVMWYGAKKYAKNNWKKATSPEDRQRYIEAALRHLAARENGETVDPESGLPHIDHALCNLYFASELEKMANENIELAA